MGIPYPECMSPDVIGELVYDLAWDDGFDQTESTKIADLCEALASELVKTDADGNPGYK
jgi:hypothetical protein